MKNILGVSLLILLMPSAYAASLPGDSADGKRLYDANCMGCHDTSVFARKERVRSVFGCVEKAVGQLQSRDEKKISASEMQDLLKYLNDQFYQFR